MHHSQKTTSHFSGTDAVRVEHYTSMKQYNCISLEDFRWQGLWRLLSQFSILFGVTVPCKQTQTKPARLCTSFRQKWAGGPAACLFRRRISRTSGFSGGCHGRQAMLVSRAQSKAFPCSHHATCMRRSKNRGVKSWDVFGCLERIPTGRGA